MLVYFLGSLARSIGFILIKHTCANANPRQSSKDQGYNQQTYFNLMQGTPGPDGEVALDIFGYLPWETVSGKASFKLKGDTITGYHITGTVVSTSSSSSTFQIQWGNGESRGIP